MTNAPAELAAAGLEILFRGHHLHGRVLEAEGHEDVVSRVIDDDDRAGALDAARRLGLGGEEGGGAVEHGLVADRLDHHVAMQGTSTGVVVRARVGRRIVLHRVHVGQRAIRLIAANHVVARLDAHRAGLERVRRAMHLETLAAQLVDGICRILLATLAGRNDPAVGRSSLAALDCALVLDPIVFEIRVLVPGDVVERDEQSRLLDVGVVPRPPFDRRQWRIRAEPLAAGRAAAKLLAQVGP